MAGCPFSFLVVLGGTPSSKPVINSVLVSTGEECKLMVSVSMFFHCFCCLLCCSLAYDFLHDTAICTGAEAA